MVDPLSSLPMQITSQNLLLENILVNHCPSLNVALDAVLKFSIYLMVSLLSIEIGNRRLDTISEGIHFEDFGSD
jgi:hypothetical protein